MIKSIILNRLKQHLDEFLSTKSSRFMNRCTIIDFLEAMTGISELNSGSKSTDWGMCFT